MRAVPQRCARCVMKAVGVQQPCVLPWRPFMRGRFAGVQDGSSHDLPHGCWSVCVPTPQCTGTRAHAHTLAHARKQHIPTLNPINNTA
jgi:hypothetical protein